MFLNKSFTSSKSDTFSFFITSIIVYKLFPEYKLVVKFWSVDSIEFNKKANEIAEKMISRHAWMLLCRERNDYTVFDNTDYSSKKKISKELIPTLHNRGSVIFMDEQKNGAWEIWIRDKVTCENFAYYLFDYSNAIINCEV